MLEYVGPGKVCTGCKLKKPFAAYYFDKQRGEVVSACKECMRERRKHHKPPVRERRHLQARRYRLVNIYSITPERYDAMMEQQGGVCAICDKPSETRLLSVDHDHACCPGPKSCGQCVRGLLCVSCNATIARLEDEGWGQRAQQYLAKHRRTHV